MDLSTFKRFKLLVPIAFLIFGHIQGAAQETAKVEPARAATPAPISATQRETIETVIREYLLKNPSVILEAFQASQAQAEKEKLVLAAKNLRSLGPELYSDLGTPTAGSAKADISVVIFFDYNCGYCKKTLPEAEDLIAKDPLIRIVYKEFPILSPESQVAALAALASARQGKYSAFHRALIGAGKIDDLAIKNICTQLGINYATLQKDMADPKLLETLGRNAKLAEALDINGTPGYVIGEQIIPGAIDSVALAKVVAAERAKLKKQDPAAEKANAAK